MSNIRLIARLDVKGKNLIKGIQLEGLRVMGDPCFFAEKYYESGIDELLFIDIVASLYGRNQLLELVEHTARNVFIPMTVGGGIRSVDDAWSLLRAGADKVAINTAAAREPKIITELARTFGSQCVVLSIEAKRTGPGKWEAYTNNGRDHTGYDVVEWAREGERLGAGEILVTSVDQEGTRKGFDVELVREIARAVKVPVIASGGMGSVSHLVQVVREGQASAVAMADILHYGRMTLGQIRDAAVTDGIPVREI